MRGLIGKQGSGTGSKGLWGMATALEEEMGGLDRVSGLMACFVPLACLRAGPEPDTSVSPAPGTGEGRGWEAL